MKIAITTEDNLGLESRICGHFGHCSKFLIAETNADGSVKEFKTVDNASACREGSCGAAGEVLKYGIDAVISGGMGLGAQQKLAAAGIKVYGFDGTAKEALEALAKGNTTGVTSCAGHAEGHCGHNHK